jgi:hypothetical protein
MNSWGLFHEKFYYYFIEKIEKNLQKQVSSNCRFMRKWAKNFIWHKNPKISAKISDFECQKINANAKKPNLPILHEGLVFWVCTPSHNWSSYPNILNVVSVLYDSKRAQTLTAVIFWCYVFARRSVALQTPLIQTPGYLKWRQALRTDRNTTFLTLLIQNCTTGKKITPLKKLTEDMSDN